MQETDADCDRARQLDAAGEARIRGRQTTLKGLDCLLDPLGVSHHILAKLSELVARWLTDHELAAQPSLQFIETPVDGGLIDLQDFRCGNGAAEARDCQIVPQVVPVKHWKT